MFRTPCSNIKDMLGEKPGMTTEDLMKEPVFANLQGRTMKAALGHLEEEGEVWVDERGRWWKRAGEWDEVKS